MFRKSVIGLAAAIAFGSANAAIIADNSVSGSVTNNFDALATGNVAGLISQTGATYGEMFSGQTLSTGTGFDALAGTPSAGLTLLANPTGADNIGILTFGASNVIYGDLGGQIGEGALSILFGSATNLLGFDVVGTDGGQFTVDFFDIGGNLLGSIVTGATDGFFGFRATAGEQIAGISITNSDPAGIGFDNVTFNASASVPEPTSIALIGLGLAALSRSRRRQPE